MGNENESDDSHKDDTQYEWRMEYLTERRDNDTDHNEWNDGGRSKRDGRSRGGHDDGRTMWQGRHHSDRNDNDDNFNGRCSGYRRSRDHSCDGITCQSM